MFLRGGVRPPGPDNDNDNDNDDNDDFQNIKKLSVL